MDDGDGDAEAPPQIKWPASNNNNAGKQQQQQQPPFAGGGDSMITLMGAFITRHEWTIFVIHAVLLFFLLFMLLRIGLRRFIAVMRSALGRFVQTSPSSSSREKNE